MASSGIITCGYGKSRSTIITRGYGRLVDVVDDAIRIVLPQARRKGGSRVNRAPAVRIDPQLKPQYPNEQYEEICVTVNITGVEDEEFIEPLRGEICKRFENMGLNVSVTDIEVSQAGPETIIEVKLLSVTTEETGSHQVSASLSRG